MVILEMQTFFQGFNFDTLLALISCIASVVALFLGGTAYKQCIINKNSFNDKKSYKNGSCDYSQKASGDINNYGISDAQLECVTTAMATMTKVNFSEALAMAYSKFQEQCDDNLKCIIDETKKVIAEEKYVISGYTKLDWINIYLESAKNTSDTYMQQVWAKVLACELANSGSIGYKTLDTLKNLSETEFRLFEQLAAISIDNTVIKNEEILDAMGFNWSTLLKLKDHGLINLEGTKRTITVESQTKAPCSLGKSHVILIENSSTENKKFVIECYLLTTQAQELLSVVNWSCSDEMAINVTNTIINNGSKNQLVFTLHKIHVTYPNGQIIYDKNDLLNNSGW